MVVAVPGSDGGGFGFGFTVADDQHVWRLLQLGLPDLLVHALAAVVHVYAEAGITKLGGHLLGVLVVAVGDGDHHRLDRSQPQRERPGVVLHEDAEEALKRAENGAVDHVGARPIALVVLEDEIEPFGQVEVKLDRGALPVAAQRVLDLDVDFWAIESAPAGVDFVGQATGDQGLAQRLGGVVPRVRFADVLVGTSGQHDVVFLEPEGTHDLESQVEHIAHLIRDLIWEAEDVRVVLGEATDPHESVQHAAALVSIYRAQLGDAQGQLTVTAQGGAVDLDVEGAVHRLEEVFLIVDFHWGIHAVPVKIEVAAGLPEAGTADMRGIDDAVATAVVNISPVVLDEGAHDTALRVPDDEAGSDLLVNGEEVELAPQGAMITALGFCEALQVSVQLFLGLERRPVDALEHGPVFVAAPVCSGHVEQLHRSDFAGAGHMRSLTEVGEFAVAVDAESGLVRQVVDDLLLVWLGGKHGLGGVSSQLLADKWSVGPYGVQHQGLDALQVFRCKGLVNIEIVVKTVRGGRAYADLGLREQLHHGIGHDVCGRMAHSVPQRCYGIISGVFRGSVVQHCHTYLAIVTENKRC